MKVTIREVTLDTEGNEDLVVVAANVTQIVRSWMSPALAPRLPAPAQIAPPPPPPAPTAAAPAPAPEPPPDAAFANRAARVAALQEIEAAKHSPAVSLTNVRHCACGNPIKSPKAILCRACASREALKSRARRRQEGNHAS